MSACGDESDCISPPEAIELAGKLDEKVISDLPKPGQVDFINGGPPCQVESTRILQFADERFVLTYFFIAGFFRNE